MIIDVFSKYGYAIPLKTKTGIAVAGTLKNLFKKHSPPAMLWTDKGKEFYNKHVAEILKKTIFAFILHKTRKKPQSLNDGIGRLSGTCGRSIFQRIIQKSISIF